VFSLYVVIFFKYERIRVVFGNNGRIFLHCSTTIVVGFVCSTRYEQTYRTIVFYSCSSVLIRTSRPPKNTPFYAIEFLFRSFLICLILISLFVENTFRAIYFRKMYVVGFRRLNVDIECYLLRIDCSFRH